MEKLIEKYKESLKVARIRRIEALETGNLNVFFFFDGKIDILNDILRDLKETKES